MTNNIVQLIREYLEDVEYVVGVLRERYAHEDLLQARRSGKVPKSGKLLDNLRFSFHGSGCKFNFGPKEVDVDFGAHGRCDGFDSWRLWIYSNTSQEFYGITENEIQEELEILLKSGVIKKFGKPPSPDLCYLCASTETGQ